MAFEILDTRSPHVPNRRVALSERDYERHVQDGVGLFTVQRGERLAIPVDNIHRPQVFLNRDLWRQDAQGRVFRKGVTFGPGIQAKVREALAWKMLGYKPAMIRVNLYGRHFHQGWVNPFNPDQIDMPLEASFQTMHDTHFVPHECDLSVCPASLGSWESWLSLHQVGGFIEDLGWLSGKKVTKAFVNVQVGAMADAAGSGEAAEFNDFNEHEVGTDNTAEANTQTALGATSGIALAAGTQVDSGGDPPVYTSVATITADATETWEEEGQFSTSTDTLGDRALTGGQSVTSGNQVQYTRGWTVNPES